MINQIQTYSFEQKEKSISDLNFLLNTQKSEEIIDYLIFIWDFHKKETVNLYSKLLRCVLGKQYNIIIASLIQNNVLKVVSKPIDGFISTGYKLSITKKEKQLLKENKYIIKLIDESKNYKSKGLNEARQAMTLRYSNYIKDLHLEISKDEYDKLDEGQKRNVDNINNSIIFTTYDKFSGRMHTNVSLLRKDLRERLTIDGEKTKEVDFVASYTQKIFHLGYIFNNDENLKLNIQKGDVYNYIGYHLNMSRSSAKDQFSYTLNAKEGGYENKKLVRMFPKFFEEVKKMKALYGHNFIAKLLQSKEFQDVLKISEELEVYGIKHFTIHDGFLVKEKDAELVQSICLKYNLKTKIK